MKLYNTLSKTVEDFTALNDKKVKLFVCGPTVYDFSHIGHAKTYTQFDVLARVLRAQGYDVFYLQNITDIDDKIITRAKESGLSWENLRTQYEGEYMQDMQSLNNVTVTEYARATDYIDDIIRQVQTLMDKGHAYRIADGIYFEIATFPDYGKLSGRTEVKENDAETRIDQSDQKRGWNDFCLWKFSKPGEPVWDAPFGKGRPGWHIEDTAITEHFFGPQYDIHGGAVDLIFPHHEAEITQMEAASGKVPFVQYWMHAGFLNIDNAKMSKSKGNFFTIREVLEKGYDPMAIRLLMLQTHYRSPINFSWENLDAAENRLQDMRAFSDLRFQENPDAGTLGETYFHDLKHQVLESLSNDLNTSEVLSMINEMISHILTQAQGVHPKHTDQMKDTLLFVDKILGLNLSLSTDINNEQKKIIAQREQARLEKNWAESDELRDVLKEQGITLRDNDYGSVWSRV